MQKIKYMYVTTYFELSEANLAFMFLLTPMVFVQTFHCLLFIYTPPRNPHPVFKPKHIAFSDVGEGVSYLAHSRMMQSGVERAQPLESNISQVQSYLHHSLV